MQEQCSGCWLPLHHSTVIHLQLLLILRISKGLPHTASSILVMITPGGSGGVEGGNNEAVPVGRL